MESDYAFNVRPTTGLGKGFAPSAAAAAKALGTTVKEDKHPPGTEGTAYSLDQMSKFIRDGRNDPRMRAWAGRVLLAAGKPATVKGQAQAILDELRKKTVYVQDPVNTELMAKPHITLCLDDHGLCMPAADCFPKGTLLLRDDMKHVPVEEIRVGDQIWGRDRWSVVTAHWFKGVLRVNAIQMNNGSTALLTADHHVYVLRCDRHSNRVSSSPCPCPDEEMRLERIRVSELKPKDRLLQPKRITFGTETMDPDRAWIEGLFISDGWQSPGHHEFSISGQDGKPKEANKKKIQELCKQWGIETRWHRKSIAVKDPIWTLRMQQMGHHAPEKHALSINLDEGSAGPLLRGIMADSGEHTNDKGRTFTTTSRQLMLQVRVLHRMFGLSCRHSYIVDHGGLGENPIWRLSARAAKGKTDKKLRVRSVERNVYDAPCYDISTDDHYVYLPEHDVVVSNCDDLVIAFCSAMMSIGVEAKIVGQAYRTEQATHVICAVLDPDQGWLKVDPSSSKYAVGQSYPASKEWWVDPISGSVSSASSGGVKMSLGQEPETGDFIGVGAVPMAHAFSPITHGASYVPVGMEASGCWHCCFPNDYEKYPTKPLSTCAPKMPPPPGAPVAVHPSTSSTSVPVTPATQQSPASMLAGVGETRMENCSKCGRPIGLEGLPTGVGARPAVRRAPEVHQVPPPGPPTPTTPRMPTTWQPWANWDEDMGAWWWGADPGTQSPQPGAQGQWVQLTNNVGIGVWVWYPTPAGVPQLLGPGSTAYGADSLISRGSSIAYAVWSTFKPKINVVDAKDWSQTAPNYWIAPDAWKQYILNNLVSQGIVDLPSTSSGMGAVPTGVGAHPWRFDSGAWAWVGTTTKQPTGVPQYGGSGVWTWVPSGGSGAWVWYPSPAGTVMVIGPTPGGPGVSVVSWTGGAVPGGTQILPGYWVSTTEYQAIEEQSGGYTLPPIAAQRIPKSQIKVEGYAGSAAARESGVYNGPPGSNI